MFALLECDIWDLLLRSGQPITKQTLRIQRLLPTFVGTTKVPRTVLEPHGVVSTALVTESQKSLFETVTSFSGEVAGHELGKLSTGDQ